MTGSAALEHGHSDEAIRQRLAAQPGPGHLRDFVYGGIDGAVTTFAIVAGVEGAGLEPIVILALGIANVLADGFSMAASNYTGSKAEIDNISRLRDVERRHIRDYPEGERREIRQILALKGLKGKILEEATNAITGDERVWIETMMVDEYGIAPVSSRPMIAALATFGAFLACGMVPLLPFLFGVDNPFAASVGSTAIVFFAIGAVKSRWALVSWWRSGLETLLIGAGAALIAYSAGWLVSLMI